jgi:hypothetical protein
MSIGTNTYFLNKAHAFSEGNGNEGGFSLYILQKTVAV